MKGHAALVAVAFAMGGIVHAQVATRAEDAAALADNATAEFYGQVMLDAIYDARRMNPDWKATLRPSEILIVCPGSPGCGHDGASNLSAR